jgi:hypothetical protein
MPNTIQITDALVNEIKSTLSRHGDLWVTAIRETLMDKNKFATGKLYDSVQFDIQVEDKIVTLSIQAEDYFKYVDKGRSPGSKMPPVQSIMKWIEIRGIKPRGIPKGKNTLVRQKESLAWAIAKSISRNGIPPRNILEPVLNQSKEKLNQDIGTVLAKSIENITAKEIVAAAKEFSDNRISVQLF